MRHYGFKEKLRKLLAGALVVVMAGASGGMAFAEEELIPVVFDPAPHGTLEYQAEVTVSKGGKSSYVPAVITEEGYEWKGWSLDGTTVVDPFEVTIEEPTTFSALYTELKKEEEKQVHRAYLSLSADAAFRPDAQMNVWELAEILMVLGVEYERGAEAPSDVLTRGTLAEALDRCLASKADQDGSPGSSQENGQADSSLSARAFSDLKNHPAKEAAARLLARGIVTGYTDGTFRPDQAVTRAEAAVMINGTFGRSPEPVKLAAKADETAAAISDVAVTHWAYAQIMEAVVEHQVDEFH